MMKPLIQKMLKPFIVLTFCALALTAKAQDTLFVHTQAVDSAYTQAVDSVYAQVIDSVRTQKVVYVNDKPASSWSIRINAAYLATGTPNLGLEVAIARQWSLGFDVGAKWWDRFFRNDYSTSPKRWRNLVVAPTVRWYPRIVGDGFFLAADGLYTHYNAGNIRLPLGLYKSLQEENFYVQGRLFGGGLSAGYAWLLGPHWRIEAEAGLIVGGYRHDTYYIDAHCRNCIIDTDLRGLGLVPRIGVGVVYTFGKKAKREREEAEPVQNDTNSNQY